MPSLISSVRTAYVFLYSATRKYMNPTYGERNTELPPPMPLLHHPSSFSPLRAQGLSNALIQSNKM